MALNPVPAEIDLNSTQFNSQNFYTHHVNPVWVKLLDVLGEGLLCGIEFQAPRSAAMRVSFAAFKAIHPGLFGQMLVMRLFKDKNILTQVCGNNFMVLKIAPPLVISEKQLNDCVESIRDVIQAVHSSSAFWSDALKLGRKVLSV